MKKVVVIGANSALAEIATAALRKKNTVITAGRKGCDIQCDVTSAISIPRGVDVVINFAAAFGGDSDQEIESTVSTNVLGTLHVCEAAKKAGVKHVIIISSVFALLKAGSPFYSIYAMTKKHGDELATFYCKKNDLPLTILRPSQIYGDTDRFAKHQPFFYQLIDKARHGETVSLYGSHDPARNYIHAADISEVILRVVQQQLEGTYTCSHPADVTYSQVATTAQKIFAKGGQVEFQKEKEDIPDNIFPKNTDIYEKIGYYPQVSLEAGLERIKGHREKLPK